MDSKSWDAADEKALDIIKTRNLREIEFRVQKVIGCADFVLNNAGSIMILEVCCENLLSAIILSQRYLSTE